MCKMYMQLDGMLHKKTNNSNCITQALILPSGRVVNFTLMAAHSIPFSTANTCSLYVTSGVSPDVVRKPTLSYVSVSEVGMPALRGVKVAL